MKLTEKDCERQERRDAIIVFILAGALVLFAAFQGDLYISILENAIGWICPPR
jgi:hypothetical protein